MLASANAGLSREQNAVEFGGGVGGANPGNTGNAAGSKYLSAVNNGQVSVPQLLCPSRHGAGSYLADYNYFQQSTSVHFGAPFGTRLVAIRKGSSNTATVTHNGCNPQDYPIGPTVWYNCNQPSSPTTGFVSMDDSQVPVGQYSQNFSSPHTSVNLVLFADGHVQSVTHGWLTANPLVWNWQDASVIAIPN